MKLLRAWKSSADLWRQYNSTQNPDLGASFPQLINIANQTAIPLNYAYANSTIQAIANVASIHFAFIEQGSSSLHPILALKARDREVLRILFSIGGVEIDHFSLWHDKMGNAISPPVAPLSDSVTGLTFPNFNDPASQHNVQLSAADQAAGSQMFQTNLILPEPCAFLRPGLSACSIIRPTLSQNGGPIATVKAFIADNLFVGQNPIFLERFMDLASAAENVKHGEDEIARRSKHEPGECHESSLLTARFRVSEDPAASRRATAGRRTSGRWAFMRRPRRFSTEFQAKRGLGLLFCSPSGLSRPCILFSASDHLRQWPQFIAKDGRAWCARYLTISGPKSESDSSLSWPRSPPRNMASANVSPAIETWHLSCAPRRDTPTAGFNARRCLAFTAKPLVD